MKKLILKARLFTRGCLISAFDFDFGLREIQNTPSSFSSLFITLGIYLAPVTINLSGLLRNRGLI
jgi:hypothetical protein